MKGSSAKWKSPIMDEQYLRIYSAVRFVINVQYLCSVCIFTIKSIRFGSLPVSLRQRWIFIGVIISSSSAWAFTRSCVRFLISCNTSCRMSAVLARPRLNKFFCECKLHISIFNNEMSFSRFWYCEFPVVNQLKFVVNDRNKTIQIHSLQVCLQTHRTSFECCL